MESAVLHEVGHSLGFDHSSMDLPTTPVMWPTLNSATVRNVLQEDDRRAISASPYMSWKPSTGASNEARDIGSSVVGSTEHTWRISNSNTIQRWNGSSWAAAVNGTGVRIDVAGATPWIVTSTGLARQRNAAGTDWIDRGDLNFVDIGANHNGVVWALGGTPSGSNYEIYRYTSGTSWQLVDGKARYIDVDSAGAPWVVNAGGSIYHRSGVTAGNPNGSSWSNYGSGARDVGAGADGATWVTGPSSSALIFLLNIQPAVAAGCSTSSPATCNVEAQNRWFPTADGGNAAFITVGKDGLPWIIGPNNSSWSRNQ